MSAAETVAAARAAGMRLGLDGTDLLIESDCEPPPQIIDALRRDKPAILALLRTRDTSEVSPLAMTNESPSLHGLTLAELEEAAGEDWPAVRDEPAMLEALAHAVVTRRQRERGECPSHWTEHCECAGCGLVLLWPGSPARVLGCPWCFNRAEGRPIPRPVAVTCGACRHFRRIDHPHLGHCAVGEPEAIAGLWDTDRRGCARWLPLEQHTGDQAHGE
ncbi:MAG: hypothetical protein QGG61_08500 [Arenicellales bacterium]|nr:hypothetical protein [Arenicellales bacterium]